jgi:hypothetical protein
MMNTLTSCDWLMLTGIGVSALAWWVGFRIVR